MQQGAWKRKKDAKEKNEKLNRLAQHIPDIREYVSVKEAVAMFGVERTTGQLKRVPRTDNNPHGLLITNWRTLLNKDIEQKINQYLTVEWVKEAQEIIDRYAQINSASPYLLPIIQQDDGTEQKQYHRMLENINYNLKKICEMTGLKMPLTTYTARHTWASIARDMDIPIPIISEGMGHNSIKTTQVYQNSIDVSKINEANKKIIRKISKKNV